MDQNIKTDLVIQDDQKVTLAPVRDLITEIKPDLETAKLSDEVKEVDSDNGYTRTGHSFDETFLQRMFEQMKERKYQEFFTDFINGSRRRLQGQILVDLGAGNTNLGYCLSLLLGAEKYIAVEKYTKTVKQLTEQLTKINIKNGELSLDKLSTYDGRKFIKEQKIVPVNKLIPASVVQDKMLHFLMRLPDKSVSILTSGIHSFLIDNTEYRDAIAREIERVLSPTGIYISRHSNINTSNLSKRLELSNNELEIKVYSKS